MPRQIEQLAELVDWLDHTIQIGTTQQTLLSRRNKALLLISFWRAFRNDELAWLEIQYLQAEPSVGLKIFVHRTPGWDDTTARRR